LHSWCHAFLTLALSFFFLVYKPRDWEIGPDLETFTPPDKPDAPCGGPEIKQAMAGKLLWACVENERVLKRKSLYLTAGYWLLGIGLAISFVLATFGPR